MSTERRAGHPSGGDRYLTARVVAELLGWLPRTVHRRASDSRAKVAAEGPQALTPLDFPLPDRYIGRTPLWLQSTIDAYIRARRLTGHAHRTRVRTAVVIGPADRVRINSVIVIGRKRWIVAGREVTPQGIYFLVRERRREAARKHPRLFQPGEQVESYEFATTERTADVSDYGN